jgi:hypothetical protein
MSQDKSAAPAKNAGQNPGNKAQGKPANEGVESKYRGTLNMPDTLPYAGRPAQA